MGGRNLASYTLKPNVSVSISRKLNTCRVWNFKVQAVNCTVSLMQGSNYTVMARPTATWPERRGRCPHFREAYFPYMALTLRGGMHSCIAFLHTVVTEGHLWRRWKQTEDSDCKGNFLPHGEKQWLSCSRESTSFWSTTRMRYIFQLAVPAHGTVQKDHKRAWCTAAAGSWQELLKALLSYSKMGWAESRPPTFHTLLHFPLNSTAIFFNWEWE